MTRARTTGGAFVNPSDTSPTRESLLPELRRALDLAAGRARLVLERYPNYLPMYTVGGKWGHEGERWTHWCEGFFPGILWLLHRATGDETWLGPARSLSRRLEPRQHDRAVHDLGFLFFSTYLREYHLTAEPQLRNVLIQAGRTLALRRQQGGYLCSFLGPHSLFIDIMMNVGLVFWAARETGDQDLFRIAREHCRMTARHLVRGDGSTAHEGIFDVETGQFLRQSTQQGWRADSTWSRGLAWALYGFTTAHRLASGGSCVTPGEFLDVARRCADCYLRRVPASFVPPWDFDLPPEAPHLWDSSAAAITASGLWDLSEAVSDTGEQQRYRSAALAILQTLCTDAFLPLQRPEWEGILMHGVYHFHKGLGVDESVAWGDHFFVEALVKAIAGTSEAGW
ncbi:MAG: glycoside hydrolase family 88 protein [Planctomycetes bacterium]|nr:glycoside hydrolase family 88 protein [Planctomycetota bacterium]